MSMAVSDFSFPRRRWLAACLAAALTVGPPLATAHELHLSAPSTLQVFDYSVAVAHFRPAVQPLLPLRIAPSSSAVPITKSGARPAISRIVTNCNDAGAGSLRATVAEAISGDVVDLSALTCSTITLTTGAIAVPVADVTIVGPGVDSLAVDGNHTGRVLTHNLEGTLRISDLSLVNGLAETLSTAYSTRGGCIDSAGSVALERVHVSGCRAHSSGDFTAKGGCVNANRVEIRHSTASDCRATADGNGTAEGGAISGGAVSLVHSRVTGSFASAVNQAAYGGGVSSAGFDPLTGELAETVIVESTLSGNVAIGREYTPYGSTQPIDYSWGGGVFSGGQLTITASTLADNEAGSGGGAYLTLNSTRCEDGVSATFVNSTISGNTASNHGGGIAVRYCVLQLSNSTVAFNHATHGAGGIVPRVFPTYGEDAYNPIFTNSIIANNTSTLASADVDVDDYAISIGPIALTGSNSLILASSIPLPAGTLVVDPMLATLSDNGGPAPTHALLSGSLAIDAGTSSVAMPFDQRGAGFPRVVGNSSDIGAFEVQPVSDAIFSSGFD